VQAEVGPGSTLSLARSLVLLQSTP